MVSSVESPSGVERRAESGLVGRRMVADLFPAVSGHPSREGRAAFRTAECPTCRVLLREAGYCRSCGRYVVTG